MTTPDPTETTSSTPPPPAPTPMFYPAGYHPHSPTPQPMLSVTPGGPIPRWVIVVAVVYGVLTLLFAVAYVAFLIWSFEQDYDSYAQHLHSVRASLGSTGLALTR